MLRSGRRVLVALSGGPDSVALLHVLRTLEQSVEPYASVADLHVKSSFPHDLQIEVVEHRPVANVGSGGSRPGSDSPNRRATSSDTSCSADACSTPRGASGPPMFRAATTVLTVLAPPVELLEGERWLHDLPPELAHRQPAAIWRSVPTDGTRC